MLEQVEGRNNVTEYVTAIDNDNTVFLPMTTVDNIISVETINMYNNESQILGSQ